MMIIITDHAAAVSRCHGRQTAQRLSSERSDDTVDTDTLPHESRDTGGTRDGH